MPDTLALPGPLRFRGRSLMFPNLNEFKGISSNFMLCTPYRCGDYMKNSKLQFFKNRPKETIGTVIGAGSGGAVGAVIGGMGVVAMGTGFGIPAGIVLGITGGLIGNRIGVGKDRPVVKNHED